MIHLDMLPEPNICFISSSMVDHGNVVFHFVFSCSIIHTNNVGVFRIFIGFRFK